MPAPPIWTKSPIPQNLYRITSPGIARVHSNTRLTPDHCDDVRHIVLDLDGLNYRYLEGQSLGVLVPAPEGDSHPPKLRLYSIASTRVGDDGQGRTASICVKRLIYRDEHGVEHRGLASNYLCDLNPSDEVRIAGPTGRHFLLPDDPTTNLILVATGTGIAPFRSFVKHAYDEVPGGWQGQIIVIFGVRTESECLYRAEFEAYENRPGFHFITAFSRQQTTAEGSRLYVQHRIAEYIDRIWPLFERPNSLMYVCGLKGMEDGIREVLAAHAPQRGIDDWEAYEHRLRHDEGRLLIETY